jgi:hypothetical protein
MRTILMQRLPVILPAIFLFLPVLCPAVESCPWLNAATAGGVLGGVVTATVSRPNTNISNAQTPNAKSSAGPTSANPTKAGYAGNGVDDADCSFVRQPGSVPSELVIDVRTMSEPAKEFAAYAARCGAHATSLKAIGNEATACDLNDRVGKSSEQVVGRVRDRAFIVRITTGDSSMTQILLREKARKVAEQVAGNLF